MLGVKVGVNVGVIDILGVTLWLTDVLGVTLGVIVGLTEILGVTVFVGVTVLV